MKQKDPPIAQSTPGIGERECTLDGVLDPALCHSVEVLSSSSNMSDDIMLPHLPPRTSIHINVDSSDENLLVSPMDGKSHVSICTFYYDYM